MTGDELKVSRLWNIFTGAEVLRLTTQQAGHEWMSFVDFRSSCAFSPDGSYVVTTTGDFGPAQNMVQQDNTACLWDVQTGSEIRRFKGHIQKVNSVAYSFDGRYVLTGSYDKTARVWDATTGGEIRRFQHDYSVEAVAISPDGKFVLTGGDDSAACLWQLSTGQELRRFRGHSARINSVAFSPDGRFVLTGSRDKTVRLWDASTGQEVRRFERNKDLPVTLTQQGSKERVPPSVIPRIAPIIVRASGPIEATSSAAFSPDGRRVLTGSPSAFDKAAYLWDAFTGQGIQRFEGHSAFVTSVVFSPDGRFVLTGSRDGTARVWNAFSGKELCRLISLRNGDWAAVTPEGRFDTNNLENIQGLHWIMPDDLLKPLPLEIFMRDYYEPRLLSRILNGEQFTPIGAVSELNRMQPSIKITNIEQQKGNPELVTVSVEVSKAASEFRRGNKKSNPRDRSI